MRRRKGLPIEAGLRFTLRALRIDAPRRAAARPETLDQLAGGIDRARGHGAAVEPGLHTIIEGAAVIAGQAMQDDCRAIGADRERRRGHARVGVALLILGHRRGDVLGLHLEMLVRIRTARIEHLPGDGRITQRRARPEVRREETDRPLEVRRVQEERPAVGARGDVLAFGLRLGLGERHRQVTVTEELAVDALLEVEAIEREQQPRRELGDAVEPARVFP